MSWMASPADVAAVQPCGTSEKLPPLSSHTPQRTVATDTRPRLSLPAGPCGSPLLILSDHFCALEVPPTQMGQMCKRYSSGN